MGAEGAAGRHRAAFQVGERAVPSLGRSFPGIERIVEAQQFAIDEGTLRVAVLPIQVWRGVGRQLPASFLRDVENELEGGPWRDPPAFVEVHGPGRGAPRGPPLRARRPALHERGRRAWAAAVGADLVVTVEIDSVGFTESDTRDERRAVRTRAGADTAFTVRSGRRQAWAQVRYVVVDVEGSRIVTREEVQPERVALVPRGRCSRATGASCC